MPLRRLVLPSLAAATLVAPATPAAAQATPSQPAPSSSRALLPGPKPPAAPHDLVRLLGEYTTPLGMRIVMEDSGRIALTDTMRHQLLLARGSSPLAFTGPAAAIGRLIGVAAPRIEFELGPNDRARALVANATRMQRMAIEPAPGTNQLRITPLHPVAELRKEALAAAPPAEHGNFKPADLVELTRLDPTIKLEIRYATTNNFVGAKFYDEARAFMQRPAAEAVVRANKALRTLGYGLLIHDAYRPWYVTKMFWDATPSDKRWLVANPAEGSKHNRGAAVDLTLFDLATGKPIDMPSTYDESTDRAYADYPGGTSLERWHRALLRRAMEAQGFTVNPTEWWHFDYKDWRDYAIGNVPFDKIRSR